MDALAICAIVKNEAPYLLEWLSFHYAQGARRFVLYDNASTDQTRAVVEAWPRRDCVTVIDWPMPGGQLHAYADMVQRFRDQAEWCAFIDADEFLVPQASLSITDVLRIAGKQANGLYVHWWMFGSSGHVTRPAGLVTETFRWRAPDDFGAHHFGKSVMRLASLTHVGLHVFRCHGRMINDSGWEIDQQSAGGQMQRSHKLLALNHYFTKSREEWVARRALGKADKTEVDPEFRRTEAEFAQHDINTVQDDRAALFMGAARAMFYPPPPADARTLLPPMVHLLTTHGTVLCWDAAAGTVAHLPLDALGDARPPLRCELESGGAAVRGRLTRRDAPGTALAVDQGDAFAVSVAGPGPTLHLRAAQGFLCAEVGGTVRANRAEAREWETFLPLTPDSLQQIRAAAGGLVSGFRLQLGADLYDLHWGVPQARLAAAVAATARPDTMPQTVSLKLYDLGAPPPPEPGPVPAPSQPPAPATAPLAPGSAVLPIGAGLRALLGEGKIRQVTAFSGPERLRRAEPFLARPLPNPVAPYAALFADPGFRSYAVPDMGVFALDDACLLGGDGLVQLADGSLLADSVASLEPWRPQTLAAEAPAAGAASLRLKQAVARPESQPGRFFCGFVGAWRNYAHWLTECLPRLFLFRSLAARWPDLRLVLPRLVAGGIPAQTLALLGIDAARVRVLDDREPLAGEIWVTTRIDPWAPPPVVRHAAEALVHAAGGDSPDGHARIYLRRGMGTRRMVGLPALTGPLAANGIAVVTMQDLSLAEQVRIMQAARLVIAENGAALANIMFCRPGARVLELFNEAWANPAHWSLASLCGLDYGYLEGRHVPSTLAPEPSHNADYLVTPDQLAEALAVVQAPA